MRILRSFDWVSRLAVSRPNRLLFIGNSLTRFILPSADAPLVLNDLPSLLSRMSRSRPGRHIDAESVSEDNATLEDALDKGLAEKAVQSGGWDAVVLQENSGLAASDSASFRRSVLRWESIIRASGARTVLYGVGRASASPMDSVGSGRIFDDLAAELSILHVPVASVCEAAARRLPGIRFHMDDGIHLSPLGVYLAACVFYLCLNGGKEDPLGAEAAADDAHAVADLFAAHGASSGAMPESRTLIDNLAGIRTATWDSLNV